jgi:hypothetical protein
MDKILKRQIEGHLIQARKWLKQIDEPEIVLPLNAIRLAQDHIIQAENIIEEHFTIKEKSFWQWLKFRYNNYCEEDLKKMM